MDTNPNIYKEQSILYKYEMLSVCLHCGRGIAVAPKVVSCGDGVFVMFTKCPLKACRKLSWCAYLFSGAHVPDDAEEKGERGAAILTMMYAHPEPLPPEIGERVKALSPFFVDMYMQAFRSENAGDFELAACGYRNALEIFIKDYAVAFCGESASEALHRKPLASCIDSYLTGFDETISAFMVKEFGNSAAHYPPLQRDGFDFGSLKTCLAVFIQAAESKLLLFEASKRLPRRPAL